MRVPKKVVRAALIVFVVAFALFPTKALAAKAVKVKMNIHVGKTSEYAIYYTLQGVNKKGKVVWKYKTPERTGSELDTTAYKVKGKYVYVVDETKYVRIRLSDGKVLKKKKFAGTGGAALAVDSKCNLYCIGYYDNILYKINKNGKVLWKRDFNSTKMYWPYKLSVSKDKLKITFAAYYTDEKEITWEVNTANGKDYTDTEEEEIYEEASTTEEILNLYAKYMERTDWSKTFLISPSSFDAEKLKFSVLYIGDNNDFPIVKINAREADVAHAGGYTAILYYNSGKVTCESVGDSVKFIPSSYLMTTWGYGAGGEITGVNLIDPATFNINRIAEIEGSDEAVGNLGFTRVFSYYANNTEISKDEFLALLKPYIKDNAIWEEINKSIKESDSIKYTETLEPTEYENTKENRDAHLRDM